MLKAVAEDGPVDPIEVRVDLDVSGDEGVLGADGNLVGSVECF